MVGVLMIGGLLRRSFFGATVFSFAVGCSQLASAATMSGAVYEPFNYPSATPLTVGPPIRNAGVGWNTTGNINAPNDSDANWGNTTTSLPNAAGSNRTVQYPGLTYTAT